MLQWPMFILNTRHPWLSFHIIRSHMLSLLNINSLHFNTKHHLGINSLQLRLHKIYDPHRITKIRGRDKTNSGITVNIEDANTLMKFQRLTPNCYLILFMWGKLFLKRYRLLLFHMVSGIIPIFHVHSTSDI